MVYQIFYDYNLLQQIQTNNELVKFFGVHLARKQSRNPKYFYDDEKIPNLSEHNTLCEWRVLFYIWKHFRSEWVGFTSWRHDQKGFAPNIDHIDEKWIRSVLAKQPIFGFAVKPLKDLIIKNVRTIQKATLKSQFLQWSILENKLGVKINDSRQMPMAKYHSANYWNFTMRRFQELYNLDLESAFNWEILGQLDSLHTWCNAFIARWEYFNEYMEIFSPIVLNITGLLLNLEGSKILTSQIRYLHQSH